ncbi:MAG TPA: hypothetical protein VEG30_18720 [Terriglobales bacterium]|nr:hypothetical protein [Terriglobales bacterium]
MKKLFLLVVLAVLVTGLSAQQSTSPNATTPEKPSAARPATGTVTAPVSSPASTAVPSTENDPTALPVGTALKIKLETPISTATNRRGDRFGGRVTEAVMLNGKTVIPIGASVEGEVMRASQPRRIGGTPTIDLHPESVTMPDGQTYRINAVIVDTSHRPETKVNDEGEIKGRGRDRMDNIELGAAAGAGAIAGGIISGGKAALIGAGVGATATTVHWLFKRRTAEVPAGTEIVMELDRPMALTSASGGR